MKIIRYCGWYRNIKMKLHIKKKDIVNGYTKIICDDCNGSGIFYIPNGEIGHTYHYSEDICPEKATQCVMCKGTGKIYMSC